VHFLCGKEKAVEWFGRGGGLLSVASGETLTTHSLGGKKDKKPEDRTAFEHERYGQETPTSVLCFEKRGEGRENDAKGGHKACTPISSEEVGQGEGR